MKGGESIVKWFSETNKGDYGNLSWECISLAELYKRKLLVPSGFFIGKNFFGEILNQNEIKSRINAQLDYLDFNNEKKVEEAARKIYEIVKDSEIPEKLNEELVESYELLDVPKEIYKKGFDALDVLKSNEEKNVRIKAVGNEKTLEAYNSGSFVQNVKKCCAESVGNVDYLKKNRKEEFYQNYPNLIVQHSIKSDIIGKVYSRNPDENEEMLIECLGSGILNDIYRISRNLEKLEIKEKKVNSEEKNFDEYQLKRIALYAEEIEGIIGRPQKIEFSYGDKGLKILSLEGLKMKRKKKRWDDDKRKVDLSGMSNVFEELMEEKLKEEINGNYNTPELLGKFFDNIENESKGVKKEKRNDENLSGFNSLFEEVVINSNNSDYEEMVLKALE